MTTFRRLRIELVDRPGALADVAGVLAEVGFDIVEVAIHEIDGAHAVDEVLVQGGHNADLKVLEAGLQGAGATLLSVAPVAARQDEVVTALTWAVSTRESNGSRRTLAAGLSTLADVGPVVVLSWDEAAGYEPARVAAERGAPVVGRCLDVPAGLGPALDGKPAERWLLAAPDCPRGSSIPRQVAFAARPLSVRFTATEVARVAAIVDCHRWLTAGEPQLV